MAVAAVIRNRMVMKYQSDGTVKGSVLKRKQFQPWNRQLPLQVLAKFNKRRMKDSLLAWRLVQDGRNVVDGGVLFYNPRIARTPRWAREDRKWPRSEDMSFTFHSLTKPKPLPGLNRHFLIKNTQCLLRISQREPYRQVFLVTGESGG